jgi:hypothetical protein
MQIIFGQVPTNHKINVTQSGTYSVYVHGDDGCPRWDTVDITFLSVVEVSLEGIPMYVGMMMHLSFSMSTLSLRM